MQPDKFTSNWISLPKDLFTQIEARMNTFPKNYNNNK